MIIYKLYVKTHNKTGLKYLGYTKAVDVHRYPGSGQYWKRHLKIHGPNYSTEIICECQTKNEIRDWGIYYSELWNVVSACDATGKKLWANLKPETGSGAPIGADHHMKNPEIYTKAVLTRKQRGSYVRSTESISKSLETKMLRYGTLNSITPEVLVKIAETKQKNGTTGNNLTKESFAKARATRAQNGTQSNSPESIAKGIETKKKNGTTSDSEVVIQKALDTRRKNGTLNTSTPESIAKRKETRQKNILNGTDGVVTRVTCPHCGLLGGQSAMKRWHFDNCRRSG